MCNVCNSSGTPRNGCVYVNNGWNNVSYNTCSYNACGCNRCCSCVFQRICRDCCGNIRVYNGCGANVIPVCNTSNVASQTSTGNGNGTYYAQQYGLTNRGACRSTGCNCGYNG